MYYKINRKNGYIKDYNGRYNLTLIPDIKTSVLKKYTEM